VLVSSNLAPNKVEDLHQIYDPKNVQNHERCNDIDEVHREYGEEVKQSVMPNDIEKRCVNLFLSEFECLPSGQPIRLNQII